MKVIQIIPSFEVAGAEIMCENLIYALRNKGIDVIVVSLYDYHSPITERLEHAGVDIRYLGKKKGLDLSMIRKLRKLFKAEKPDVIHTHLYALKYAAVAAMQAKVKQRVHTVHSVAEKECGKNARRINKFLYKYVKVVPVALSNLIQKTIQNVYKLDKQKIPVIFNGIDLLKCQVKEKYSIQDKIRLLHIGRFCEVKNHKGLIESFALFHEEYPNSVLQLIGGGELREEMEKLVTNLGLTACVEFLGLQDNVYKYLHEADIFVLPSLYEGIPMTLIEAMATGLPIVATKVGGIPDMLTDNENGLLVQVSVDQLKDAFVSLQNEELRKRLGQNAKLSSEMFSSIIMADKYIEVYRMDSKNV